MGANSLVWQATTRYVFLGYLEILLPTHFFCHHMNFWTIRRLCPLCDQEQETMQHLLRCVVAREVWSRMVSFWGKPDWLREADSQILRWWSGLRASKQDRRNLWTAITLVFWCQWRAQEQCGFQPRAAFCPEISRMVRVEY